MGTTIKVKTLNEERQVKIEPGTVQDTKIVIEGQGVQKLPPD